MFKTIIAVTVLAAASAAHATVISTAASSTQTFNFDSLSSYTTVQSYINSVAGTTRGLPNVKVTGAVGATSLSSDEKAYALTNLANSNEVNGVAVADSAYSVAHGLDGFIHNVGVYNNTNSPYGTAGNDKITMDFLSPITSIGFDWEVMPNGTCTEDSCGKNNANFPSFELWAGSATTETFAAYTGDANHDFPVAMKNGAAQGLGYFFTTFSSPVTHVEFADWPVEIGIDNLVITEGTRIPEPSTVALMGMALASIVLVSRRRKA